MTKCVVKNLLEDVVSVYDQTKTTIQGRVFQKTLSGEDCLGPPLTKFIDVTTDTTAFGAVTPGGPMHLTSNGRLFVCAGPAAGLVTIVLYNFNLDTGATSIVGRLIVSLPNTAATTHTIRGFKVVNTGTTGWKMFIATTGSVLINGGLFMANSIDLADFTASGTTIPFATGSNQKAVYFLQNSGALGTLHTATSAAGLVLDTAATRIYLHNGVSATHQYRWFDYSGTPNVPGQTFTVTIATPGVVTATAHGFLVNDQVVLSTTGALPTGLLAGTVYFARNVTANTFELSATSGGASIATSGTQSGTHTVRRAFGITGSLTHDATGNLPALTGTLLNTNNENRHTPTAGPNASNACIDFLTSSNVYRGRISELTTGATTWPSLESYNITSSTITAPTAAFGAFLETVQKWVYVTNGTKFVQKGDANSSIDRTFGSLFNKFLEAMPVDTVNFGLPAIGGFENQSGWILINSSTTGVRGVVAMDFRSDSAFDYSYIVSPVYTVNSATLKNIAAVESLFESTGTLVFYYRTSGFGSIAGGWTEIATAEILSIALGEQVQFKVAFDIANEDASTPGQIISLVLGLLGTDDLSSQWVGSPANSQEGPPTRFAFRLQYAYESGTVPELIVDAYDDTDVLVATKSTVTHASDFEYSTNNGFTWSALGTIPNTALTTELRLNLASMPGTIVRARIREA
jgi:uncharacterized membrane protein required for colicin V production